jgi:hypothetical protein
MKKKQRQVTATHKKNLGHGATDDERIDRLRDIAERWGE